MSENLHHYYEIVKNLRAEGQTSRADAVEYLIRRCEAAENVIYCCTTPPWTVEDYWNAYKLWQKLKSEMEAGDETSNG